MRSVLVILFSLALPLAARAEEKTVLQAGETFVGGEHEKELEKLRASKPALRKAALQELKIKQGDALRFTNNDSVAHNVYGEGFDLKKQDPGEARSVTFDKKGEFQVKCMIHPKMKFKVKVE